MIFYDLEVFKYDWMIVWLDTNTRKFHSIVNDKKKLEKFYEYYKNEIWVGYNSRNYDQWIVKAILCDFNPWDMNVHIIEKDRKGYEFSKLLNKFPIYNYDCSYGFRSLKECEAFMGHDIRETSVPFNIDRKLTPQEIEQTLKYCMHDVGETFEVFVETKYDFETHIGLIREFGLPFSMVNKTGAQLCAEILEADQVKRDDEFDITIPDNIILGKYQYIKDHFERWARDSKNYEEITLETTVCGVKHTFGVGGIHGALERYYGEGYYLMADVGSYYPAGMIEYNFLSRNVRNPEKYRKIRDERLIMKKNKDPRQEPRKLVLNKTFGASKDKYNKLYDPRQANNLCIANQLFLVDLLEKLEGKCELIQSNTDGILLKLFHKEDKDKIIGICEEWCNRTRFQLEYEEYHKVIQRDVNNYIIIPEGDLYDSKGKERFKRKGAVVKKLSRLDNDLPIVNKAVVDYFVKGIPVEKTVMECDDLIMFQKVTKITGKYEYGFKEDATGCPKKYTVWKKKTRTVNKQKFVEDVKEERLYYGYEVSEKVHRCFASLRPQDGALYKKSKTKPSIDKTPSTPDKCFIDNTNIENKKVPYYLDKQWYIKEAKERISNFI